MTDSVTEITDSDRLLAEVGRLRAQIAQLEERVEQLDQLAHQDTLINMSRRSSGWLRILTRTSSSTAGTAKGCRCSKSWTRWTGPTELPFHAKSRQGGRAIRRSLWRATKGS